MSAEDIARSTSPDRKLFTRKQPFSSDEELDPDDGS